jgi:hypothetical protein
MFQLSRLRGGGGGGCGQLDELGRGGKEQQRQRGRGQGLLRLEDNHLDACSVTVKSRVRFE